MDRKIVLNLKFLTKIRVEKKQENTDYEWVEAIPGKSYLFGLIKTKGKPAGWMKTYTWDGERRYSSEHIKKGYSIEGKKIFERPWVGIYLNNERVFLKTFDEDAQAELFADIVQFHFHSGQAIELEQ